MTTTVVVMSAFAQTNKCAFAQTNLTWPNDINKINNNDDAITNPCFE